MVQKKREKASTGSPKSRADVPPERREDLATAPSATAVAAEAHRTGVVPLASGQRQGAVPREDALGGGEADARRLDNESVGDEAPSGHMMTPDQDRVDDIGRAMGVQEADSGALRSTAELLDGRDQRRAQQEVPDPSTRDIPERTPGNR